jgi:hypothetical protein
LRFLPGRLLRFLRAAETREHAGECDGNDQTQLNSHSITSLVKSFFAVDVFYVD